MAIATTVNHNMPFGNRRLIEGVSVLSGTTATGEVITGLERVDQFFIFPNGATAMGCSVNETLPLNSGTVTAVVETNDSTFYWIAIGA